MVMGGKKPKVAGMEKTFYRVERTPLKNTCFFIKELSSGHDNFSNMSSFFSLYYTIILAKYEARKFIRKPDGY